jgi:hypothetical protein
VKFQYKASASSTWSDLGSWLTPPPYSFGTTWDVTSLAEGSYDLRVAARDTSNNTIYADAVTVTVGQAGADISEAESSGGGHQKIQSLSKDRTENVDLYDGTGLQVLYGTLGSDTTADITILSANPYTTDGANASLTGFRQITLTGDPTLNKMVIITIPYEDSDSDGYLDGTSISENDLKLYCYDESLGEWTQITNFTLDTTNNIISASVPHLSDFALADPNYVPPTNDPGGGGGGGGCFISAIASEAR